LVIASIVSVVGASSAEGLRNFHDRENAVFEPRSAPPGDLRERKASRRRNRLTFCPATPKGAKRRTACGTTRCVSAPMGTCNA